MKKTGLKKAVCFLALAALLGTIFAGCGSAGDTQGTTTAARQQTSADQTTQAAAEKQPADYTGTVSLWAWDKAGEDAIIKGFNEVYPNLKVDAISVGYDDYMNKIQTSIAADSEIADILLAEMGFRARLLNMDILEDLEQAPYNFDKTKVLDYVVPITSFNGKVVGVDDSINSSGFAYKADLAKKYLGTDDPAELEKLLPTWDVFVEKGKEIQSASGGKVFLISCWADLQEYYNNFGTEAYTAGNKVTDFTLDTRATERYNLLKAMMDGVTFDKSIPGHYTPADNASFTQDNHIFYLCALWGVNFVLKSNDKDSAGRWRVMQAPGGPFNQGGTIRAIWKDSKNKENAWQYINYGYNSIEGCEKAVTNRNYYPPYKPFIDQHDFSKDADPYFGTQNVYEKYIKEMAPNVKVRAPEVYQNQIYDAYAAVETAVLNDKKNEITLDKYKEMLKTEIKNKCPDLEW